MRKASELSAPSKAPKHKSSEGDAEIGRKLRELRARFGLTQEQVIEEVNVSRPSLVGYEQGLTLPNIRTLAKLAAFYDVPLDELAGHLKPNTEAKAKQEAPND